MKFVIFADTHDHLANILLAVDRFNDARCDYVIFAGDLVSTFAIPPLRKLKCPMIASFGDNEGNKLGICGGMEIIGEIGEPPFCFRAPDGTRFLITHQFELARDLIEGSDVVVYAHTHRPRVSRDEAGRLLINPGETSGWSFGEPTIVLLETEAMQARIVQLVEQQ